MLHLTHIEWETLKKEWYDGNDAGQGSPFGDSRDTPKEAALREGYDIHALCEDGSALAHSRHKHYYLVCADNGPWGVDVTECVRAIVGDEVTSHA
jgi:hypothetical protein